MTAILAIDQGTTNTKALLLDGQGQVQARAARPVPISYPRSGWVEQDANLIWRTVLEASAACLAESGAAGVRAIGVANQRETVVAWDRETGAPLSPCVSWQCQRAAELCAELKSDLDAALVAGKTGLHLDPMFSGGKFAWLLRNVKGLKERAQAGKACLGTIDSWIVWKLTGGRIFATDASNASRTLLMNIHSGAWDADMLSAFGVPSDAMPEIRPSSGYRGETASLEGLPGGIPIMGVAGDSHAALFGHRAFANRSVKATYGTGSSLMMLSDAANPPSLSRTIAWDIGAGPELALEGNIIATGAAVDWAARLSSEDKARAPYADTPLPASDGVYLVPAFTGLGAPHWNSDARAMLYGMSFETSATTIRHAAIEAIAYQIADVFDIIEAAAGVSAPELLADGGAARNDALMQFQADIIDRPVVRNRHEDLSAYGAGLLAGLGAGIWRDTNEIEGLPRACDRFEPAMDETRRESLLEGWREAVGRATMKAPKPSGSKA